MHTDKLVVAGWFYHDTLVLESVIVMELGQLSFFSILPDSVAVGFIKSMGFCFVARDLYTKFVDGTVPD